MKFKAQFLILLIPIVFLTACSAPAFNHVIINESKNILEVEYEYVSPMIGEESSQIANPAKVNLEQYANGATNQWNNLTAENGYESEMIDGAAATAAVAGREAKPSLKKVKIRLLPGEVLRVFVSNHITISLKNLKKISLRGENGTLAIEGEGFEQFAAYRPGRFFTDTEDYRIVYR